MKITLDIGEAEIHRLDYQFNQLTGTLVIRINQQPVLKATRWINEPAFEAHALTVGENERHVVRIERERKPLLGHRGRVFVDNRLVRVFEGN